MAKPGKYERPTRSSRRRKRSFKGNQHKPAQTTADKRLQVEPEPEVVQQQQTLDPEQHTEPDPSCSRIGRSKRVFCFWKEAEIR